MHNRNQVARLLTLVFFFNFSGLSNGVAYLVVSSGRIEAVNFAPALVKEVGGALNPKNWKKMISDLRRAKFLFGNGSVVWVASQSAVQGILVRSKLTQLWLSSFVKKVNSVMNGDGSIRGGSSTGIKVLGARSIGQEERLIVLPNNVSAFFWKAEDESWIDLKRFLLNGWKKCKAESLFTVLMHGRWRNKDPIREVRCKIYIGRTVGIIREKILHRVFYAGGESKDEPAGYFTLKNWSNI